MKTVCFLILHYGDPSVTDRCVHSILHLKEGENVRIIIIDNEVNKAEEEREKLLTRWNSPKIRVLLNHGTGGFSEANNLGYRFAREEYDPLFIIAANNDIEFVQKDFILNLYAAYEKKACHVMGPYVRRGSNGEPQNPIDVRLRSEKEAEYTIWMNRAALRFFPIAYPVLVMQEKAAKKKELTRKKESYEDYKRRREDVVLFGACLIFTPLFIQAEENAFWPETSFYYEEYLLMLRCISKGYKTVYDPSMKVLHESGTSTERRTGSNRKKMRFVMRNTADACEIYLNEYRRVNNYEKI